MILSTVLLALALAAAHLPRLAARTRYAIIFIALLKFAVPSTIVPPAVAASVGKPVMLITALRPLSAPAAAPAQPPLLVLAWAIVAIALAARLALRWHSSVAAALAESTPFDDGALAAAMARVGLRRRVALRRSPSALAPVTIGIAWPVIVIPRDLSLGAAELESILAHECAHVARHDNALAIIEALFGCALWFHPLVWIARRVLGRAREEACDERVVASGDRLSYLDALTRVAAHGVALPTAGVSCAAGSAIEERIEAIMKTRPAPLPHRLVLAAAVAVIALLMMGSAPAADEKLHELAFTVARDGGQFVFDITITDKSGKEVAHPHVTAPAETRAELIDGDMHVMAIAHTSGQAEVTLRVIRDGRTVETIEQRTSSSDNSSRISLNLKDADVRDVINTFGKLANLHVVIDDGVSGTVTVDLHDVPWTQALDQVLHDAGLHYELRGSNLHVSR